MTKELHKAITEKSKAGNKYLKWPSRENYLSHKKNKNKCNTLTGKAKIVFLRLYLTNKGCISNNFVSIEKDGEIIINKKELAELFNENYINIVENTSGTKPSSLGNCLNKSCDEMTVKEIISVYSSHPSTKRIKQFFIADKNFDLPKANVSNINKIIKSLNTNKAKGPDDISAKFVKMSASVIDCHLANFFNNDISNNNYSEHAKTATVRPIFKKDDRTKIKNY